MKKPILALLLILALLPLPPQIQKAASAGATNVQEVDLNFGTTKIDGKAYLNNSTMAGVKISLWPGRKVASYKISHNGQTMTTGATVSGEYLILPTLNGQVTTVYAQGQSNPGYTVNRLSSGKQWRVAATDPENTKAGLQVFDFTPVSGTGCVTGTISDCPGSIPSTVPGFLRYSNGDAVSYSADVPPPGDFYLKQDKTGPYIPDAAIVQNTVRITGATTSNLAPSVQVISFAAGNPGKGKLKVRRALNGSLFEGKDYDERPVGSGAAIERKYKMTVDTKWQATTYAYQTKVTITYEAVDNSTSNATGDFDILPDQTITMGDTFKFHPHDIKVKSSCTFKSIHFVIERDGEIYTGSDIQSQTTDDVYTVARYPTVIKSGETHLVTMIIKTSCGEDTVGPKNLDVLDPGATPSEPPSEPPAGENHPPFAKIEWEDPNTGLPVDRVKLGDTLNLRAVSITDPDGDILDLNWDFTRSTDWLKSMSDTLPPKSTRYDGIQMTSQGVQTVYLTVTDPQGLSYTATTTVTVIDAKPVAVIDGPSRVKEKRPLPFPFDGSRSYSPFGRKITNYEWTNKADRYDTPGDVEITLRVQDEDGRWSEIAKHDLTVIPDQPPIALLSVPSEETRLGSVHVESASYSPDGDNIVSHVLELKYDAANDGFASDSWTKVPADENGSYDFTPTRVGKYLFRETVCEDYGLCANSDVQPEAQRTVNVVDLAPTVSVETSSDTIGSPESTPLPMADLFNNGRFYSINTGNVGDKSNWKLENGVLKTKVRQPLMDVHDPHEPTSWDWRTDNTYHPVSEGLGDTSVYFDSTTFGLKNPIQTPFLSMQSAPTFQSLNLPVSGTPLTMAADDKYIYVETNVNNIGMVYALNKNLSLVWSQSLGAYPLAGYGFVYDKSQPAQFASLILNNNKLYVQAQSDEYYYFQIMELDRDTGTILNQVKYNWTQISNSGGGTIVGIKDGILLRGRKYDSSLNLQTDAGWIDILGTSGQRGLFIESNGSGSYGNALCIRDIASMTQVSCINLVTQNMYGLHYLGTDKNGNFILFSHAANYGDPNWNYRLYTLTPSGTLTFVSLQQNGGLYNATQILGIDSSDRLWFEVTEQDGTVDVAVFDMSGNLIKKFYPYPGSKRWHIKYMFVGADNLVTLMGVVNDTQTAYKVVYSVVDPSSFSTVTTGITPSLITDRILAPSYIRPIDDGTFIIEIAFADYYSSYSQMWLLKTTGGTSYPKVITDIGESTPDLITGANVEADKSLKVSLKAAAPNDKATGVAYRIQDDRNYYSLEFEANELRLKKTVNGAATIVQSKPFPMVAGQTYSVEFVPGSGQFSVYVNRILQWTITETGWTSGKFGVINRGQQDVSYLSASITDTGSAYGTINGVALVGEPIKYDVAFDDPEKDPRLSAAESWDYTHNPNVFLNSQGLWNGMGTGHSATPITSFDKPGEYTFKFKSKDDPNPDHRYPDSSFAGYRQESNEETGTIRVHRRPIADFSVTLNADHTLTYVDRSYDPDRYDPATRAYSTEATGINYAANHGILEWRWRYKLDTDTTYNERQPTRLYGGTYDIELSVKDEYGAWSPWVVQMVTADGAPPQPPTPGFTITPNPGYRFEPVTINSTASDPQDGGRENLEHAYYIKNLTAGGQETLQSDARTSWGKVFSTLGVFNIRQVVTNSYGQYAEVSHTVTIVNRKPSANLTVPASSDRNNPTLVGLRPEFDWTYSDPDDDPQAQWQIQIFTYDGTLRVDTGPRSGADLTWIPTADLASGTKYYAQVRAFDGNDWSAWSSPKYFMTNRPPTGDFSWSPEPIYEGDTVTFMAAVDDPDRDTLQTTFEITSPSGLKRSFQDVKAYPYSTAGPSLVTLEPGVWTVALKVSDGIAPTVAVSKTLRVWPLGISGQVRHTDDWEANRLHYNEKHPDAKRPADWFWAGEAFVLQAQTTDTGSSATKAVKVLADAGGGLRKPLAAKNAPTLSLWSGTLGSADAGFPLVTLPEGDYTFTFTVTYSNGVVKTAQAKIHVADTVDDYMQIHRIQ